MQIFWSWQSDTPGKIGRFFIRDALIAAVERMKGQLKEKPGWLEPTEREEVEGMAVDQDRQGVSGSRDLAASIRAKIAKADLVVADVTLVGAIDPLVLKARTKAHSDGQSPRRKRGRRKRLINSNVGIELGYGYESVEDSCVLLVINDHFGPIEDLPFDLRGKSAVISYTLAPDADAAERKSVQKLLVKRLAEEIELCLPHVTAKKASQEPKENPATFPTVKATYPGIFFKPGEILAESGGPGEQPHYLNTPRRAFLRFHPLWAQPQPGLPKMVETFQAGRMVTLSLQNSPITSRNRFGAIGFESPNRRVEALVQGFPSGELWGVNGQMIREHHLNGGDRVVIPIVALEKAYVKALRNYVAVATKVLGFMPPFQVTMGVVGVKDGLLGAPGSPSGGTKYLGPIFDDEISHQAILNSTDDGAVLSALKEFFVKLWAAAAASRDKELTDALVQAHDIPSR